MRYEMIFGDERLFDGAGEFTGIDIVTRNVDDGLYRTSRLSDSTPSTLRKNPVAAMRRIIPEPKRWTWEDKKAGVLPEVGSKCLWCNSKDEREVIAVTDRYIAIECDNDHMKPYGVTHEEFTKYYNPIETPEEKAQRERDEWVNKVMSKTEHEPFCANADCKFHKYSVYVGVKHLEYIDPVQFDEIQIMQNSSASPVNDFYHVSHIKRDWIYKDGRPLGQFCTKCARILLGLTSEADGDE